MTLAEFSEVIQFLERSSGRVIATTPTAALERTNIYYSFLGDLPIDVLRCAAEKVLLEPLYNQFPTIEALRRLATDSAAPPAIPANEAWKLAWDAACKIDPSNGAVYRCRDGKLWSSKTEYQVSQLPPMVQEAVRRFGGLNMLANTEGKFAREPFCRIYDGVVAQERQQRLLPEGLRRRIAAIGGDKGLPVVAELAGKIGAG